MALVGQNSEHESWTGLCQRQEGCGGVHWSRVGVLHHFIGKRQPQKRGVSAKSTGLVVVLVGLKKCSIYGFPHRASQVELLFSGKPAHRSWAWEELVEARDCFLTLRCASQLGKETEGGLIMLVCRLLG